MEQHKQQYQDLKQIWEEYWEHQQKADVRKKADTDEEKKVDENFAYLIKCQFVNGFGACFHLLRIMLDDVARYFGREPKAISEEKVKIFYEHLARLDTQITAHWQEMGGRVEDIIDEIKKKN